MSMSDSPIRLEAILRALPQSELDGIVTRLGVRVDLAKRLDPPAQIARALVALPELREPTRLPPASVELMHRVAEAGGSLLVPTVPNALAPLAARGLMFARAATKHTVELVLPAAYVVQLKTWEGEDPRGIRALLAQASFESTSAIASHYLGRPATPPIALSLEPAWEVLSNPSAVAAEIEKLAPSERRVLEAVERDGGEVDTEELLELEREPMRVRTAAGVSPSRRGVGSALERRGFLVPVHPNRHVVPTEVSVVVGAVHRAARVARREKVRSFVLEGDHAPRRARFAPDPAPIAMGLALVSREGGVEVRAGVGTPKSLVQRLATRFGREPAHIGLLVALSRAVGLWDASALSPSSPPGSFTLGELVPILYGAWRRGGAWDEAREDAEAVRLSPDARDASPVGVVRELVLEALRDLGEGWIPWASLFGYFRSDHRMAGLRRLFRRWAERAGVPPIDPLEVARRIAHESLPALGVVDLGEDEALADEPPDSQAGDDISPQLAAQLGRDRAVTLRLTPRGRALVANRPPSLDATPSKFENTQILRVGPTARVANVLGLGGLVEVARVQDALDLLIAPQTLARALSAGIEADVVRQRLESIAPLPDGLSKTLAQASVVLGRGTYAPSSAFLWVEDPNLRELLRTRRATGELFVDPSPPGGLLVAAGVDLDRLTRRCRTVGIEIVFEGQVVRARSMPPPGTASGQQPRTTSSQRLPKVTPTPMPMPIVKKGLRD
jgi:hypothetical protein